MQAQNKYEAKGFWAYVFLKHKYLYILINVGEVIKYDDCRNI